MYHNKLLDDSVLRSVAIAYTKLLSEEAPEHKGHDSDAEPADFQTPNAAKAAEDDEEEAKKKSDAAKEGPAAAEAGPEVTGGEGEKAFKDEHDDNTEVEELPGEKAVKEETSGHESTLAAQATATAGRNPSKANHLKAVEAHKNAQGFFKGKAAEYHLNMAINHAKQASEMKESVVKEGEEERARKIGTDVPYKKGDENNAPTAHEVSKDAFKASGKAGYSGEPKDHAAAYEAHMLAAKHFQNSGNKHGAEMHLADAGTHLPKSGGLVKKEEVQVTGEAIAPKREPISKKNLADADDAKAAEAAEAAAKAAKQNSTSIAPTIKKESITMTDNKPIKNVAESYHAMQIAEDSQHSYNWGAHRGADAYSPEQQKAHAQLVSHLSGGKVTVKFGADKADGSHSMHWHGPIGDIKKTIAKYHTGTSNENAPDWVKKFHPKLFT